MLELKDLLNAKISYQENTWSEISKEYSINNILDIIKSDNHKFQIEQLRTALEKGDKEYYDSYKKRLPAITFSATFEKKRLKENLKIYNPVIVIDIDKLDDESLQKVHEHLSNDKYVTSFWRSPSNRGFKGLVSLNYSLNFPEFNIDLLHKSAFKKLSEYFHKTYEIVLDSSGNDITRLCFLSHDTELVLKPEIAEFVIEVNDIKLDFKQITKENKKLNLSNRKDLLYNPFGRNNQFDRKFISDIIRYLDRRKISITNSYADWCKVAMAISNSFTYEIGVKYFLKLSALDKEKFNEIICINFLNNCYETRKGNVNFSTIVYLANLQGFKTKYQKNGVPKGEG